MESDCRASIQACEIGPLVSGSLILSRRLRQCPAAAFGHICLPNIEAKANACLIFRSSNGCLRGMSKLLHTPWVG